MPNTTEDALACRMLKILIDEKDYRLEKAVEAIIEHGIQIVGCEAAQQCPMMEIMTAVLDNIKAGNNAEISGQLGIPTKLECKCVCKR